MHGLWGALPLLASRRDARPEVAIEPPIPSNPNPEVERPARPTECQAFVRPVRPVCLARLTIYNYNYKKELVPLTIN